jgi:hypothetical protein
MVRAASSLQTGALDIGDTECPSEGGLTYPAEQSAAPDCRKRPLLRRVRFRQQVSASVSCPKRNTMATHRIQVPVI